jgi:hypothetical protein
MTKIGLVLDPAVGPRILALEVITPRGTQVIRP